MSRKEEEKKKANRRTELQVAKNLYNLIHIQDLQKIDISVVERVWSPWNCSIGNFINWWTLFCSGYLRILCREMPWGEFCVGCLLSFTAQASMDVAAT